MPCQSSTTNLLAQRLCYRSFGHSVGPDQLESRKSFSYSTRYLTIPQARPYKSKGAPSVEPVTKRDNNVLSRSGARPSTASASNPLVSTSTSNPALNPPSTTRPPVLNLPEKTRADPIYKYYFGLGKAYLTFYKNGLKGIYSNYQIAKALPNRLFHPLFVTRRTLYAAAKSKRLSRADLRLLLRLRADTKVLPVFALVFICCGEFTPLLVPWLTAIVPPSVHIPSQTKALRERAEIRRQQARAEGPPEWRDIRNIWDLKPPELDDKYLRPMLRRLARELALYPPWWEKFPLYMKIVGWRFGWRMSDLKYDDLMIMRDGGVKEMISEEVTMACDRRGLVVEGKEEKELRRMLEEWLRDRNSNRAQKLVDWLNGERVEWRDESTKQGSD